MSYVCGKEGGSEGEREGGGYRQPKANKYAINRLQKALWRVVAVQPLERRQRVGTSGEWWGLCRQTHRERVRRGAQVYPVSLSISANTRLLRAPLDTRPFRSTRTGLLRGNQ